MTTILRFILFFLLAPAFAILAQAAGTFQDGFRIVDTELRTESFVLDNLDEEICSYDSSGALLQQCSSLDGKAADEDDQSGFGKLETSGATEALFSFLAELVAANRGKTWTKAPGEYIKDTRHAFDKKGGVRQQYWQNEYATNKNIYSPQNQALIKQGKAPFGTDGKPMVLHHKTPIEYGGTNNFSNLQPMRYTDHSLKPNFGPLHTPPFPD